MQTVEPLHEDHFWSKVDLRSQRECWLWKGKRDRDGYGIHRLEKRDHRAHRLAYHLACGELPKVVRHACDNRACCNPHHLQAGTQRENMQDKVERNRQAKGSKNGRAKLTEKDVVEVKRLLVAGEVPQGEIARRYGVSRYVIRDIKQGKTWAHVTVMERADSAFIEGLPLAA